MGGVRRARDLEPVPRPHRPRHRPRRPVYGDYTDFLLFLSDIAVLATLGFWVLSLVLQRRRLSFGPRFLVVARGAAAGGRVAGGPVRGRRVAGRVHRAAARCCSPRSRSTSSNELERLDRIVAPVAAMIVVQAIVGIGQVVGQSSLGLSWLGRVRTSRRTSGSASSPRATGRASCARYGLTDHPNILGGRPRVGAGPPRRCARDPARARALLATSPCSSLGVAALLAHVLARAPGSPGGRAGRDGRDARRAATIGTSLRRLGDRVRGGPDRRRAVRRAVPPTRSAPRTDDVGRASPPRPLGRRTRGAGRATTTKIVVEHPVLGVGIGTLPLAMRGAPIPRSSTTYQPASVVLLDVTAETGMSGAPPTRSLLVAPWLALLRRRRWTPELAVASGALAALTRRRAVRLLHLVLLGRADLGVARARRCGPSRTATRGARHAEVELADARLTCSSSRSSRYLAILLARCSSTAMNFIYLTVRRAAHGRPAARGARSRETWPMVTVQLPIYNELYVAGRLIDDVGADRLPGRPARDPGPRRLDRRDRDDRGRARRRLADKGVDITHVRRDGPRGVQGGRARATGSTLARGELHRDLRRRLRAAGPTSSARAVPAMVADPGLAFVQARWGHVNRDFSLLTRLQAVAIDGHFGIEQAGRWATRLLLQLQRHGRRLAAQRAARRGRLAGRHADRGPRHLVPRVPRAAGGRATSATSRRRRSCR